jgi:hypothetical protein
MYVFEDFLIGDRGQFVNGVTIAFLLKNGSEMGMTVAW